MVNRLNIKLWLFYLCFFLSISYAQEYWSEPAFPTEGDNITVYFDPTRATGKGTSLNTYTGDIYAHTGMITDKSTSSTDWKNVIGSWGSYSQPKLVKKTGTNIYYLVIGNLKNFYPKTDSYTKVLKLAFVFRSADGTKQTEDRFITIYESNSQIRIIQPSVNPSYYQLNTVINLKSVGTGLDSSVAFSNGKRLYKSTTDTLKTVLTASVTGKNTIVVKGYRSTQIIAQDSIKYYVWSSPVSESLPANIQHGINYINQSTVTLALYAPNKKFVYVVGDFNNWEPDKNYQLKITPDKNIHWITLNNLVPGTEYAFQYLVDGEIKIADPYADKILDPSNDQYIDNSTYPGLKSYPTGKTTDIVSVLQTAQTAYNWQVTNFVKPAKTDLFIYELLVRDFSNQHTYKAVTDSLDYLKRLGVNAIELMPVNEFEGNSSWGYNPSFYFAPDKYYGPKNELKRLIDECHKRGIAVIIDMVLNHSYGQNPIVKLYPNLNESPWFNVTAPHTDYSWGYDFNHERQATKDFIDRVNKYWIQEYKVDGFRFDFTRGFTNKAGGSGPYDASRIAIIKRMADQIWAADPSSLVIIEHLVDSNDEMKTLADYGMLLWGNMNYNYGEAVKGRYSDLNFASYQTRGWTKPHLITYMESHDEERNMYRALQEGSSSGDYSVKNLATALARVKLAAVFFMTIPGPKMIWQFGELGYDYSINYNGRLGEKPVKWDYYSDSQRKELYKVFSYLAGLKTKYNVFKTSDFSIGLGLSTKSIHLNDSEMKVTIIGNFDVSKNSMNPAFQNTGKWYDYFSGDSINVTNTESFISLEPGEFHIYTTKKLPVPEKGILTDIVNDQTIPVSFGLKQNYPNPFNPSTVIEYSLPQAGFVKLKVFDSLGREITTLVNEFKAAGNYSSFFTLHSSLATGVYIYRLSVDNKILTKKMMFLK